MGDYNVGAVFVNAAYNRLAYDDAKIHGYIDKLSMHNMDIKILSDLINEFTHAKQSGKEVDFNDNERVRRYIVHVHKNNPTIFGDLVQGYPAYLPDAEKAVVAGNIEEFLDRSLSNIEMSAITIGKISPSDIDAYMAGLDPEIKALTADVNTDMLHINRGYDEISNATEQAQRGLRNGQELNEHIIRKTGNN